MLAILARQNRTLGQLAADSDRVISELANRRRSIASFINSSQTTAAATASERAALERQLVELPGFLRELRTTMGSLDSFAGEATPAFANLRAAAPSLTRAARALGPFSDAGTGALTSLGRAAEAAGPPIVAADPVIRQVRGLARGGEPATVNLKKLLKSLRKTDGFDHLADFIFYASGVVNGFDQYGHFVRSLLPLNNCVDYELIPEPGCGARFAAASASGLASERRQEKRSGRAVIEVGRALAEALGDPGAADAEQPAGGELDAAGEATAEPEPAAPSDVEPPPPAEEAPAPAEQPPAGSPEDPDSPAAPRRMRAMSSLMDFLIGAPAADAAGSRGGRR